MIRKFVNTYRQYNAKKAEKLKKIKIKNYLKNGQKPWSVGYWEYRNEQIAKSISDAQIIETFKKGLIPGNFGYKLDERIVEYCWIFSQIPDKKVKFLDAGSTFNYDFIINNPVISQKELTILTYAPENPNFNQNRISYVYADLREIPLKGDWFDMVVSQSTIEHIDMDNSMYGYDIKHNEEEKSKSYDYLKAIDEMLRVLKKGGKLLLTFPFGKFENHGFFQQFDDEMINRMKELFEEKGNYEFTFFKYNLEGWVLSNEESCSNEISYNPHTGKGKGTDGAAHSRAICCVKFNKNL